MLDTIGKRLKCCRAATGTTTHEVVDYIHSQGEELSYPTYTRWEAGSAFPGKKTAHLIGIVSDFFKKNGLQVEANWILSGKGFRHSLRSIRPWMKIRCSSLRAGQCRTSN